MEDFKNYSQSEEHNTIPPNLYGLVQKLATDFNGKSTGDILKAIYAEAERGKRQGRLKNTDIDNFAMTIYPFLDDKMRKYLKKLVDNLKKI